MNENMEDNQNGQEIPEQKVKTPVVNPAERKTYIITIASDDVVILKSVIVALTVFDALRKCATRFRDEECDMDYLTVQIEETEVIE